MTGVQLLDECQEFCHVVVHRRFHPAFKQVESVREVRLDVVQFVVKFMNLLELAFHLSDSF